MRLANAAFGLAAVGAGLLVARMVMNRKWGGEGSPRPPEPAELIGYSPARKSAEESAEILRDSDRPM